MKERKISGEGEEREGEGSELGLANVQIKAEESKEQL